MTFFKFRIFLIFDFKVSKKFKIPIKENIQSCHARRKHLQLLDIEENDDLTLPEHTAEELDEVDHEYLKVSTLEF